MTWDRQDGEGAAGASGGTGPLGTGGAGARPGAVSGAGGGPGGAGSGFGVGFAGPGEAVGPADRPDREDDRRHAWGDGRAAGGPAGSVEFVLPPMPLMPPAAPPAPADPTRALAVALFNLGGLGLGYALIRRPLPMLGCWAATAVLLFGALPADPDGVSRRLLAGYAALLALAAVHGGARALRTPLSWPPRSPIAVLLGVALLAAPVGGALLYDGARDDAVQAMLLDRLDAADHLVRTARGEEFADAEPLLRSALAAYRDLHREHAGSRAARLLPARMAAYYAAVAAPYAAGRYCQAVAPLTFLRTVPAGYGAGDLGALARWPDDKLATSLYECGARDLADDGAGASAGRDDFAELLTAFPRSPQAARIEPAVRSAIAAAAAAVGGGDPCRATARLRALGDRAAHLPGGQAGRAAALGRDARQAVGRLRSGAYACGVRQYRTGDFAAAQQTMAGFSKTYPHDARRALAQKFAIAAEIARQDPAAGRRAPTTASGGGITMTVSNDSPDPVQVLFTGVVTGSFTLAGCRSCHEYPDMAAARSAACASSGAHYPHRTLGLPPGTVYFLHKDTGEDAATPGADSETLRYGYAYTECAYTVQRGLGL